jgi:histone H1/5
MALSSQELRELCTPKEWALILASQPGAIEKLSATALKNHASNARKLVSKWQDLSRSQARVESRKSGSPNPESRSHDKHEAFRNALTAFQAQLAAAPVGSPASRSQGKPPAKARSIEARSQRRDTRKTLGSAKHSLNRAAKAAAPKPVASKPDPVAVAAPAKTPTTKTATKKASAKKPAAKKPTAKNASAKLAAQRKNRAVALASAKPAAPQAKPARPAKAPKAIAPKAIAAKGSPAAKASLDGKVKATRTAIAGRTNKIAGHVSGKGKRVQGKRDARGR